VVGGSTVTTCRTPHARITLAHAHSTQLLLSSQFWPIPSMSRRVINCAKQCLSHPFSRIKWIDQWAVEPDPVLTWTTSAKIGKTAIKRPPPPVNGRAPRGGCRRGRRPSGTMKRAARLDPACALRPPRGAPPPRCGARSPPRAAATAWRRHAARAPLPPATSASGWAPLDDWRRRSPTRRTAPRRQPCAVAAAARPFPPPPRWWRCNAAAASGCARAVDGRRQPDGAVVACARGPLPPAVGAGVRTGAGGAARGRLLTAVDAAVARPVGGVVTVARARFVSLGRRRPRSPAPPPSHPGGEPASPPATVHHACCRR